MIGFDSKFFKQKVVIYIGVDFAAEGAVNIVLEAAVTKGNVAPLVADSCGTQIYKTAHLVVFEENIRQAEISMRKDRLLFWFMSL